ncbi:hypothetical protein DPMN_194362 [Dreissena polymorpha]|uniref:PHD-type domain-containing protein n=1 Tax=Dreissena polymorpha TaxID=45954 RepID=A0A9D3Y679_DREPO|nr:hypothetical protein DPMN_194362 [Dreissena polymorpha]
MYQILSTLPEDLSFYCRKCFPVGCPEWETTLKREMREGLENILQTLILAKSAQYILKNEKKKSPTKLQITAEGEETNIASDIGVLTKSGTAATTQHCVKDLQASDPDTHCDIDTRDDVKDEELDDIGTRADEEMDVDMIGCDVMNKAANTQEDCDGGSSVLRGEGNHSTKVCDEDENSPVGGNDTGCDLGKMKEHLDHLSEDISNDSDMGIIDIKREQTTTGSKYNCVIACDKTEESNKGETNNMILPEECAENLGEKRKCAEISGEMNVHAKKDNYNLEFNVNSTDVTITPKPNAEFAKGPNPMETEGPVDGAVVPRRPQVQFETPPAREDIKVKDDPESDLNPRDLIGIAQKMKEGHYKSVYQSPGIGHDRDRTMLSLLDSRSTSDHMATPVSRSLPDGIGQGHRPMPDHLASAIRSLSGDNTGHDMTGLDIGHALLRRAVLIVAALVSDHVVTHGDVILEDLGLIAADPHLGRSRSRHRRKRGRRQPSHRSAEVGSETSIEVEHYYLTSINFMFETRRMNCFNRLYLSATDFAVSVTEQLGHINDASRISKTTFAVFCEDILRVVQTYLDDEEEARAYKRKAVTAAKGIFAKQVEKVFPWFNVKECRHWYSSKSFPNPPSKKRGYIALLSQMTPIGFEVTRSKVTSVQSETYWSLGACISRMGRTRHSHSIRWTRICINLTLIQAEKWGMLPDATLPPSTDHTYAQWIERVEPPRSPQPSPYKKFNATPVKRYIPYDEDLDLGQLFEGEDERPCMFCQTFGDQRGNEAGRLLYCGQDDWCHINCALWSAEVYEDADGALMNLAEAFSRGKQLRCDVCDKYGATVGCNTKGCKSNYHFMCARRSGCLLQEDKKVFCQQHLAHVDGEWTERWVGNERVGWGTGEMGWEWERLMGAERTVRIRRLVWSYAGGIWNKVMFGRSIDRGLHLTVWEKMQAMLILEMT